MTPVAVAKHVSLKCALSRLWIPVICARRTGPVGKVLGPADGEILDGRVDGGARDLEMAWMPWNVPARTRASLLEIFWRPGEKVRL